MATGLYIISNIETSKEVIIAKKDNYLMQLKALGLSQTYYLRIIDDREVWLKSEGDWEYEFPTAYDDQTDSIIPDTETEEIISFDSPFVFSIRVYPNCLELTTIYRYRYLYEDGNYDALNDFRRNVYDIISIFGGTEIIYLADCGCDKLSSYLELQVWEGISYQTIKKDMVDKGLKFVSDYTTLQHDNLSYANITEIVFDEFKDFKTMKNQTKILEMGAEGGSITLFQIKDKKDTDWYFHSVHEMAYMDLDLEGIDRNSQYSMSIAEAFIKMQGEYKNVFSLYPLMVHSDYKYIVLALLEEYVKNIDENIDYQTWAHVLEMKEEELKNNLK